ncbi:hypothetical protein [Bacteroides mediterraneensis]|uniref:hypothetical protein n=1 Tax=Bacteroides mediterraneensis TaxID=1841856 RepID=UPI0026EDEAC0|nr:hypothetical protein [Bacteroides mediterraneensis]
MKKIGLLIFPMAVALCGCQSDEKRAGELFQRAETAYAAGEYSLAKLQIDSIRTLYPKAFEVRKAGIKLMQQIDLAEQTKTLTYLDSMMTVKQAALDSIKGKFVLEKDTAYQEVGNYFYPTQVVEKNIGRSFLRAQVNEQGEMSLTSIYCAGGSIHHTAVKVSVDDTFAETPQSVDSYETTDLGRPVEKADYKLGQDGGVIAFLVANRDKKNIRLEFIGDRNYKTVMRPDDVKAVAELSELARVLSAMEEIKKEQKEANLKIKFVKRKMEENPEE